MDHTERDRRHTAERYVLDLLPPDERAVFEEHFVDCAECIAVIERAEAFHCGISAVAAADAATPKHPKRPLRLRLAAWLMKQSKWGQTWMLVAACALFTAGPFLFFYTRLRDANLRIAALHAENSSWERRYISERENADRLKRLVDQVRAGQGMVTQLVAAKPEPPPAGAPIVPLEAGVTARLEVTDRMQWVILTVQLREPFAKSVNAELFGGGGNRLARVPALKPDARGVIAVSVMTSLLESGGYRLSVANLNYPFQVRVQK